MNYEPQFEFGQSLNSVSAHQFLSFIDVMNVLDEEFVLNKFILDHVKWSKLIENSKAEYALID